MNITERRLTAAPADVLRAAREELIARTRVGQGGRAAVSAFSDRLDAIIQHLVAAPPSPSRPAAVLAIGGYGRRQLCLHSDIDLLVLFDGSIGPEEEGFVRGVLNPLWDLQLTLGHQVRELADLREPETDNAEFLLALVDARLIAGETTVFDRFTEEFHRSETHASIVDLLKKLIVDRHAQFNDTLYQLEPDIKDAPGALRDLMALRVIARLTDPALLERGPADQARLSEAEEFLLRIRSILHLESKRNQNALTHELQEPVAQILGYGGNQPQQRVERLMSDYFRHARVVARTLSWIQRVAPQPIGVNLAWSDNSIRFVDNARAAREPRTWLSVFHAAIDADASVADESLNLMQQHAAAYDVNDFLPSQAERDGLLRFLDPRPGLYARLSEMHDCGLLGSLFPEFQRIASRVVRDFYHKYTVDEHTLLAIRQIERLRDPAATGFERFGSLLAELDAPEILVLTLLYHDVGKWRDDEHVAESVRLADVMMERLRLPAESRATVDFLIRHHIAMSLVAFRRDTEDPGVVKQFASLVGTEERLKLLCLLTMADVEAVSPGTLTPWRQELLWRLYVDAYNQLTLGYGDDLIARDQAGLPELLDGKPAGVSAAEITRFVEGFPRRYLHLFSRDAIYQHVRLSRDIQPDHVHATLEEKVDAWELTVVTLDKPFLFSNICGVLSSFGMDILRGHAFTNPNGLVLDTFQFTDSEQFLERNADGRERLLEVLEAAVSGKLDITARLRARERGIFVRRGVRRVSPTVRCDNQTSDRYTILDIVAGNVIGLLHRLSLVMSRHGCEVDLVLISTEGDRAIDVFHITQAGHKLSEDAQRVLATDLERMLEELDEAS